MADQTITLRITADGKAAIVGIDKVDTALKGVGREGSASGAKASAGLRQVETQANRAGQAVNKARNYLLGFASAAAVLTGVKAASRMADEYTNLTSKIRLVTDSERELASVRSQVIQLAQDTRAQLVITGDLYTKLARSTENMHLQQSQLLRLTRTINESFVISGAEASSAAAAITQLGQGLASGTLRGDEFNSVAEQAPTILHLVADYLHMTTGELRAFAAQGGITAEIMVGALSQGAAKVDEQFGQMQITIAGATTQLKNAITVAIGARSAASGASVGLANTIHAIAANFGAVADGVIRLGEIIVAVFVGKALLAGRNWILNLRAQTAAVAAEGVAVEGFAAKTTASFTAARAAIGRLGIAVNVLGAGIVGWQIGSYLRDQFLSARLAGIAFVDATLTGWQHIKQGAEIMWAAIKAAAVGAINFMRNGLANIVQAYADVLAKLPNALGGGRMSAQLGEVAASLRPAQSAADGFAASIARINDETAKNIAHVHAITDDMADYAIAQDHAKAATEGSTQAQAAHAQALIKHAAAAAADTKSVDALAKAEKAQQALLTAQLGQTQKLSDELAGVSRQQQAFNAVVEEAGALFEASQAAGGNYIENLMTWATTLGVAAVNLDKANQVASNTTKDDDPLGLKQFLQYTDQQSPFDRLIEDAHKWRDALKEATDPATIARLNTALDRTHALMTQALIGSSVQALRGIQTLSKEGSKEYEAMNVAASALAVVQAVTAIIHQGTSGDPYSAFARMAAMAAAVAPLLASIGQSVSVAAGSGFTATAAQRQGSQGTGSVLGDADAKSESIANATEITANATEKLVGINTGMLHALQTLQANLGSAGAMLARGAGDADFSGYDLAVQSVNEAGALGGLAPMSGFGDLFGLFGGSSKITDTGIKIMGGAITDLINSIAVGAYEEVQSKSWAFGSTHTKEAAVAVSDEFQKQFQLILQSIVDTVSAGATALGLLPDQIQAAIAQFQVAEQHISLQGLSAEDQQKALEAVFSKIFDGLAASVVPFVAQFQTVGEGLGETLVRVATEVQVTQEAMRQLGLVIDTTDPEKFAQIADGLTQVAGGIDNLISGLSSFVDKFEPAGQKLQMESDALNMALSQVGLTLPSTRDGMWALMQSLDATTAAGREQIATLLRLADVADQYYSAVDKQAQAAAEAAEKQQQAAAQYRDFIASVYASLDTNSAFAFVHSLVDLAEQRRDAIAQANALAKATGLAGASEQDLAAVRREFAEEAVALIAKLQDQSKSLVQQLYGGVGGLSLDQLNAQIAALQASSSSAAHGIGVAAKSIDDTAHLLLGDLSPFKDSKQLQLAKQMLLSGQASAQDVLQIGRRLFASGADYTQLFQWVQANAPRSPRAGVGTSYSSSANTTGASLQELIAQRDKLEAAQRLTQAQQLAANVAQLASVHGESFEDVAKDLGFSLTSLAKDLGVSDIDSYLAKLQAEDIPGSLDTTARTIVGALADLGDRLIAAITGTPIVHSTDALVTGVGAATPINPDASGPTPTHTLGPTAYSTATTGGGKASLDDVLAELERLRKLTEDMRSQNDAMGTLQGDTLPRLADAAEQTARSSGQTAERTRELVDGRPVQPRGVPAPAMGA